MDVLLILYLQELEHARKRGAPIYARVASYAATADAFHITRPAPDGAGAYRSMKRALASAQIPPSAVSYINAHATSTPLGDVAEARAIAKLMCGENGVQRGGEVSVSSVKGAIGHLLGAAGAVEALYSVLAIKDVGPTLLELRTKLTGPQGIIPATLNLEELDDQLPELHYVRGEPLEKPVDVVLTNSFGFGGTNATLCIVKHDL